MICEFEFTDKATDSFIVSDHLSTTEPETI